jgi:SM-20-related protein
LSRVEIEAETETEIAEQLGSAGLCVWPNFLSPSEIENIRSDFNLVYASGGFHQAAVGQGSNQEIRELVRNDETFWLEPRASDAVQTALLDRCKLLKTAFNQTLFLGLNEFEGHYAAYAAGGFYRRHLDSFVGDPSRIVSLVIYLNEAWKTGDGGELRIHSGGSYRDIEPIAGTLVCFISAETEHEVLTSRVARCSFAGWFKRPSHGTFSR